MTDGSAVAYAAGFGTGGLCGSGHDMIALEGGQSGCGHPLRPKCSGPEKEWRPVESWVDYAHDAASGWGAPLLLQKELQHSRVSVAAALAIIMLGK